MAATEVVGRLAEITERDRLRALRSVTEGRLWALGLDVFGDPPQPSFPGRPDQRHLIYRDWSHYEDGSVLPLPGGVTSVDDGVQLNCHGGSHLDALGHIMCEGMIAGGYPASSTIGGLRHADVASIARVGIVCRGVVVDLCRSAGVRWLPRDHEVTVSELQASLQEEGVILSPGDMLLLRTGSLCRYYEEGPSAFFTEYSEPGLSHDDELLAWIDETRILGIGTDTLANELPRCPATGEEYPLHRYLLRDRGLQFHEALWLEEVATDCALDGRFTGLYVASPLKLVGASGSPVNPLFMK
jgi:kynurenine formamidase